jgi:hypothetical protein
VCTTIKHIIGKGRSSAATSHVRPNKLSAGMFGGRHSSSHARDE